MNKNLKNNEDLVVDLMNFSPYGALSQSFVIDALRKQAKTVSELTDEEVEELDKECGFISMKAWRGVARDIHKRMEEFYNGHRGKSEQDAGSAHDEQTGREGDKIGG